MDGETEHKRFDPRHVQRLIGEERLASMPPDKILAPLAIQQGDVVADIGCGPGFFTLPAARQTTGVVYGIDVSEEMLHHLTERAEQAAVANVKPAQATAEQLPLADHSVHKILCAMVLHEMESLPQALAEMHRVLTPDGLALLIDWEKHESTFGPPLAHRLAAEDALRQISDAGFVATPVTLTAEHYAFLCRIA